VITTDSPPGPSKFQNYYTKTLHNSFFISRVRKEKPLLLYSQNQKKWR